MDTWAQKHQYDNDSKYRNQQCAIPCRCVPYCANNCCEDKSNYYQYSEQQSMFEGNYPQEGQMDDDDDDDITVSSCRYKHCMDELFDSLPWLFDSVDKELSIQAANKSKKIKSESDFQDIFQQQPDNSSVHDASVEGVPLSEIDIELENISDDSTLFPATTYGWKNETVTNVQDLYTTATCNSLPLLLDSIKMEELALQTTNEHKWIESDSKYHDIFHQNSDGNTLHDASEEGIAPIYCKPISEIDTKLEKKISVDSTLLPVTSYGWQEETVSNVKYFHTKSASISLPWLLHSIEMEEQAMQASSKRKRIESDNDSHDFFQQNTNDSRLHDAYEAGIAPNYYKPLSEIDTVIENRIYDESTLFPVTSYGWQKDTVGNVQDLHATAACISLPWLLHSIESEEQAMQATNKRKRIESDRDTHEMYPQNHNDSRLYGISKVGITPNYCKPMSEIHTELENKISENSMWFLDTSYQWHDETVSNEQDHHITAACNMNLPQIIPTPESPIAFTENTHEQPTSDKTGKGKRRHKYKCSLCNKTFIAHTVFQSHMNKHNGIRAHVCDICNKGFFTLSNLTGHKTIHTKVKPYICSNCGSDFRNRNALFAHLVAMVCTRAKKHISETSNGCWSCLTCNLNFQTKTKGYSHARVHQKGLALLCPVCPENFTGQKSYFLVKHCRTEHPEYFQKLVADNN